MESEMSTRCWFTESVATSKSFIIHSCICTVVCPKSQMSQRVCSLNKKMWSNFFLKGRRKRPACKFVPNYIQSPNRVEVVEHEITKKNKKIGETLKWPGTEPVNSEMAKRSIQLFQKSHWQDVDSTQWRLHFVNHVRESVHRCCVKGLQVGHRFKRNGCVQWRKVGCSIHFSGEEFILIFGGPSLARLIALKEVP